MLGLSLLRRRETPRQNVPLRQFSTFLLGCFRLSQYVSASMVWPLGVNSTRSTPLRSQNTVTVPFRTERTVLNIFGIGEAVCRHRSECLLDSGLQTRCSSPVTTESRNSSPSRPKRSENSRALQERDLDGATRVNILPGNFL